MKSGACRPPVRRGSTILGSAVRVALNPVVVATRAHPLGERLQAGLEYFDPEPGKDASK
jgi:hypothetical protein